jgi:hypothetical protein
MRIEPKATCEADRLTGTSGFTHSSFFGMMER